MDHILPRVVRSTKISLLDWFSGYNQILVHPDDQDKTAFTTPWGTFKYVKMPFGLKNAGSTYQRAINHILHPHQAYASAYIDDTIVYSSEWDRHMDELEQVLASYREAGMTLKLRKCDFAKPRVEFVGHLVGSGQIAVIHNKTEAISRISEPTTKSLLRSFLGMATYYRAFIKNYSQVVVPLTELTKSKHSNKIVFNAEQQAAFNKIKTLLCSAEALHAPDYSLPFEVHTDASNYAIGATLCQRGGNGEEKPIGFFSAKLNETQQRWSTIEKEAYSVIAALNHFDVIVFGREIKLFTDHNPLTFLVQCVPRSAKLCRWGLALQRYNITVVHRSGQSNANADCLSRMDYLDSPCGTGVSKEG